MAIRPIACLGFRVPHVALAPLSRFNGYVTGEKNFPDPDTGRLKYTDGMKLWEVIADLGGDAFIDEVDFDDEDDDEDDDDKADDASAPARAAARGGA